MQLTRRVFIQSTTALAALVAVPGGLTAPNGPVPCPRARFLEWYDEYGHYRGELQVTYYVDGKAERTEVIDRWTERACFGGAPMHVQAYDVEAFDSYGTGCYIKLKNGREIVHERS